jgi:hypothetical protein
VSDLPDESVEQLRAGLLEAERSDKEKLSLLKKLVLRAREPGAREAFLAAAACEGNAGILEYIVRSFGYLGGPEVVGDVTRYIDHPRPIVAANAVRAAAAVDPRAAVRMAGPMVRRSRNQDAVWAVAAALASKCRAESSALFREMAFSARSRHRMGAIVYARALPENEAAGVFVEMFCRERDPALRDLLRQEIEKRATAADAQVLRAAVEDLTAKAAQIEGLLGKLTAPGELPPVAAPSAGADGPVPPIDIGASDVLDPERSRAIIAAAQAQAPAAVPHEGAPAAVPHEPVPTAAPHAAVPAPRPLAPSPSGRRTQPDLKSLQGPPGRAGIATAVASRPLLVGLCAVLCVAAIVAVNWSKSWTEASRGDPGMQQSSPIGPLGGKVHLIGAVMEVKRDQRVMIVQTPEKIVVTAFFPDHDVAAFAPGHAVDVDGIVREVRSPTKVVVQGLSLRKR